MPAKLSSLQVDLAREKSGVWEPSMQYPGVEYLVSSLLVPDYLQDLELLNLRLHRKYKGSVVPTDVRVKEMGKLYAKHILHGWKGFDEEYTAELAEARLSDPSYRPLTMDVVSAAIRLGEPDAEYTAEDEVKNSEAPSAIA